MCFLTCISIMVSYDFNCRTFKTPLEVTKTVCEHVVEWCRLYCTSLKGAGSSQTTFFIFALLNLLDTPFKKLFDCSIRVDDCSIRVY